MKRDPRATTYKAFGIRYRKFHCVDCGNLITGCEHFYEHGDHCKDCVPGPWEIPSNASSGINQLISK